MKKVERKRGRPKVALNKNTLRIPSVRAQQLLLFFFVRKFLKGVQGGDFLEKVPPAFALLL